MIEQRLSVLSWAVIGLLVVLVWLVCGGPAWAQVGPLNTFFGRSAESSVPRPSVDNVLRWTDQAVFHEWRIQRHVETGEYRLLDGDGRLHARGTLDACREKLLTIRREQQLPPMQGRAVVLLHGLAGPAWSMKMLAGYLHDKGDYSVFPIDYSSLRSNVDDHARSLARVIESLEGIEQIDLVGHSLGNIVIRRYLAGDDNPDGGWVPDQRLHRVVMIAPPNHGALTATRLANYSWFKSIFGEAGQQLGADWDQLQPHLATPPCEFGIIAGGLKNQWGFDPFQPGDDDGRITVATTKLVGASDFIVVPELHELIAHDPRVFAYTLRFLRDGYFVAADQRQPITADDVADYVPGGARRADSRRADSRPPESGQRPRR
ncbi:MAG: alpha/beta fold hydrolase [Pirellulales bacterium]